MNFGLISDPRFLEHDTGGHVENAGRLRAIYRELGDSGLLDRMVEVGPRPAADAELRWLHSGSVIERIERAAAVGGEWLDPDTYVSAASAAVARDAAGGAMELAGRAARGELDRGFALLRPPGHHSTPLRSMGFCLYSNVALAARYCQRAAGMERIFIFDWDVHHGNGTQDCLYEDGGTCFFSFHRYPFYPGTGAMDERGAGPGEGLTYNLPLSAGLGDGDYLWAFDQLVAPVCRRFDPQMILVSAGYDAHRGDPLGGMGISTEGFRALAQRISRLSRQTSAQGRLVGFLEGGYNPTALAQSVRATLEAWLSDSDPEPGRVSEVSTACRRQVSRAIEMFGL